MMASVRLDSINQSREDMKLVSNTALENAPPSLAFATVAMGAFRGLVVDILWIRAENLKEKGQFFDAKQMAEWITTLQPRFAAVWDFQAWNMAYNISVAMPATQWQERWKWVRNGYELLRDRGIKHNPKAIDLYRSLAWIFQHKMGGVTDDCHKHYKRELAESMRMLLYPMTNEYFDRLKASPETFEEMVSDAESAVFVEKLAAVDEVFGKSDEFVKNYFSLRLNPQEYDEAVQDVIIEYDQTDTLRKFDTFARSYTLRNDWSFDIDMMIEINSLYGPRDFTDPNVYAPLNWEQPDAHAIYWAFKGLEVAGEEGVYSVDEKNTDRIVFHSLQNLFRMGKMIIYPVADREPSVFLRPDLNMYDVAAQAWRDVILKYGAMEKSNPKGVTGGYKNFMINAIALFYQAGQKEKAGKIYLELREKFPLKEFNVPLVTFVKNRLREELSALDFKDSTEMILMSLSEAYFRFAVYDDDEAFAREEWAKDIYKMYAPTFKDEEAQGIDRINLPIFEKMRYVALIDFINNDFYPQRLRQNLMARIANERPDLAEKLEAQQEILFKEMEEAEKREQGE
jgi:hypothetical protein